MLLSKERPEKRLRLRNFKLMLRRRGRDGLDTCCLEIVYSWTKAVCPPGRRRRGKTLEEINRRRRRRAVKKAGNSRRRRQMIVSVATLEESGLKDQEGHVPIARGNGVGVRIPMSGGQPTVTNIFIMSLLKRRCKLCQGESTKHCAGTFCPPGDEPRD